MHRTVAVLIAGVLLFAPALVSAQGGQGGSQGALHYDPATEITLTGNVDEVKPMPAPGRGPGGLHLMVRAETRISEVVLGPAWFVSSKNFEFAKGDNVTVTGSKTTMNGQEVLVAREVKKSDKVLTLRDAKGFPLWSGRARGSKS